MNKTTALKIAREALKKVAQRHTFGANCYAKTPGAGVAFAYDAKHYHAYTEAYNVLTAMQMGLDDDVDESVFGGGENKDNNVFSGDEKEQGWRESQA